MRTFTAILAASAIAVAFGCDRSTLGAGHAETEETASVENGQSDEPERGGGVDYEEVPAEMTSPELSLSDEQWRERLSDDAYYILRESGTEEPHSGDLLKNSREGIYLCQGCGEPLFSSGTKFESGTGWPSFHDKIDDGTVGLVRDDSQGMQRVEVYCTHCGGHLGHLFQDGPEPTGLRYCINSDAMEFEATE